MHASDFEHQIAADRGKALFNTTARCATCHLPTMAFADVNLGILHQPEP
jgi:mono/diheme cytochrome c family protein